MDTIFRVLPLSVEKTKIMCFRKVGGRKKQFKIEIEERKIESVNI